MENSSSSIIKFGIFSKLIFTLVTIFYFSTYLNKNFNLIWGNIPLFSLLRFELFRLIPAIFISDNLFDLFFNYSVVFSIINFYENKEGTIKTFIKFFINACALQIFVLIIYLLMYYLSPVIMSFTIKPLPALGIAMTTKHILTTEEKFINTCFGSNLNNRFLLLFSIIFGLVINYGEFKFEFIISIYFGFLMCKFQKYLNYSPSEEDILHFEKNESYKFFFNLDSWISIEECYFKSNSNLSHEDLEDINTEIEGKKLQSKNFQYTNKLSQTNQDMQHEHLDLSDNTDSKLILERFDKKEDDDLVIDLSS
jgi:hypothetical protein